MGIKERARAHCLQNKTKEAKNQRRIKKGEHKTCVSKKNKKIAM